VQQFPIEASVDEFVDAVTKETGHRVICFACGNHDWATYDATPMTVGADNLRPGVPDDESSFGLHVVPFACTRCGLLRLHAVRISFPPESQNE
jgi:hypothetical protein